MVPEYGTTVMLVLPSYLVSCTSKYDLKVGSMSTPLEPTNFAMVRHLPTRQDDRRCRSPFL